MNVTSPTAPPIRLLAETCFTQQHLATIHAEFFAALRSAEPAGDTLRWEIIELVHRLEQQAVRRAENQDSGSLSRIRDCALVLRNMVRKRSEEVAGFSVARALGDIAAGRERPDLTPGFFAELLHLLDGLSGQEVQQPFDMTQGSFEDLSGRSAAAARSGQLDSLWAKVSGTIGSYPDGLAPPAIDCRAQRREKILGAMGATLADWEDWRWQVHHVIRELDQLAPLVRLTEEQEEAVGKARRHGIPFGITPYYLSLMDEEASAADASIRAQVLPPLEYVDQVCTAGAGHLDFMGEEFTSPIDLITRRYPGIAILKPFNTCPQICVYCQRNWEIDDVMASGAFAGLDRIEAAVEWLREHPAISEVLVTGGDPLAMGDKVLGLILEKLAQLPHVERIRLGTRTFVTMPMRITAELADMVASFRQPGGREVALITHVQHPYEITPEMVAAVDLFRQRAVPVYNQLVYTFFNSRRFEAAALRKKLRLIGIDPYYTFNTKGKDETLAYRVPVARLLQEQQEEARLLPGLVRTDEAVFNLPRIGKSYLKSKDQRDLLAVLPDGARVYEFHPWERYLSDTSQTYIFTDVPILSYLERLEETGECASDYETIWYYF